MIYKKASHVGVILSFVIFITFIIFLYSAIEPMTKVQRGKQDLVKYLKTALINEFKENLTSVSIAIKDSVSSFCVKINSFEDTEENTIVKNIENNEVLSSYLKDNKINIKRNQAQNIKIYYSKEFPKENFFSCNYELSEDDYTLGSIRTTKEIFKSKIINLTEFINEGDSNYNEIKKQLKIPPGSEFGFSFEDSEKKEIAKTKEKNISTNIYVEEIPIQYIDSEANINPGFLRIRVW